MAKTSKKKEDFIPKTPIVAVMGHVDHGKTSLLDAIRGTSVVDSEAGGITQNSRAHQIEHNSKKITFIDTPGHQAFSLMRERGAKVTDIVLIVVAADDGVQPQTRESIRFALAQKTPVIVVINKIDLPNQNLPKLKQQISAEGLLLEEYGGDVMVHEVSAIKKTGIKELLDSILLLAEMQELKQNVIETGLGSAYVLESKLDNKLGSVTLALIKAGTFEKRQFIVYPGGYSRIRELLNEEQKPIAAAQDGDPVWVIGANEVLGIGHTIVSVADEKQAKALVKQWDVIKSEADDAIEAAELAAEQSAEPAVAATDEEPDKLDTALFAQLLDTANAKEEIKYINVILKSDAKGTLEVVESEIKKLEDDEVKIRVLDATTGPVTQKDVMLAKSAKALILAFQVECPTKVAEIAKKERVLVRKYGVIYELVDEVEEVVHSYGTPVEEEIEVARAKVKLPFKLSNGKWVAGSEVTKGTIIRGYRCYVQRGEERAFAGKVSALKRGKNDVKEVAKGIECGIMIEPNEEILEGDIIVLYKVEVY